MKQKEKANQRFANQKVPSPLNSQAMNGELTSKAVNSIQVNYMDFKLVSDASLNMKHLIPDWNKRNSFTVYVSEDHSLSALLESYRIEVEITNNEYLFQIHNFHINVFETNFINKPLVEAIESLLGLPFDEAKFTGTSFSVWFPVFDYEKVVTNIKAIEGLLIQEDCEFSTKFKGEHIEIDLAKFTNSELWIPGIEESPTISNSLVIDIKWSAKLKILFDGLGAEHFSLDTDGRILKFAVLKLLFLFRYKSVYINPFFPNPSNNGSNCTELDLASIYVQLCGGMSELSKPLIIA